VRLTELRPQFRQGGPGWGDTNECAEAIGIEFDCPGCVGKAWSHRIWAPFLGRYPMGPAMTAQWTASGSGYHDLTFSDAPGHSRSIRCIGGCRSHFNVTSGAIDFYDDSGHTTYRPQEMPVTEPTSTSAPEAQASPTSTQSAPPATTAKPSDTAPTVTQTPLGYVKTHVFEFINGILHQLHEAPHSGQDPPKVLVPVPGSSTPPGLLSNVEQLVEQRVQTAEKAFAEKFAALEAKLNTPAPTQS
jgi:hypothetical protein